jgi:uncharacterized protein
VRIVVEELPDAGRRISGHTEITLAGDKEGDELRVAEPVGYDLELSKLGTTVTIRGSVEALVGVPCSRCGQQFAIPVDRSFEAVFVTADTGETDRAIELDESALDLDYYQGGVIDVPQLLAEQVFLELPMKILCAEDCKGLCAKCGANLNHQACECEADADPRWASLEGLRDQL